MREFSRLFRAMNTEVTVAVAAEERHRPEVEAALDGVEGLFGRSEAVMSRFLPESELSSLNRSAGHPFRASPLLFAVVSEAMVAAQVTEGLFDPTVLGALVRAGYDRSFESMNGAAGDGNAAGDASAPCNWQLVRLEPSSRTITLPTGCGLDLGGIAKGWTVDRALERLRPFGHFAVDAGGDLYAAGLQADGSPWTVGVEDPFHPDRDLRVLAVRDQAVATSSISHRRWLRDGRPQHHLIDPRTGQPAESGVVAATVLAGSVGRAELLAKMALLLGPEEGLQILEKHPAVEGLLILATGRVVSSAGLREVTHAA